MYRYSADTTFPPRAPLTNDVSTSLFRFLPFRPGGGADLPLCATVRAEENYEPATFALVAARSSRAFQTEPRMIPAVSDGSRPAPFVREFFLARPLFASNARMHLHTTEREGGEGRRKKKRDLVHSCLATCNIPSAVATPLPFHKLDAR